MADFVSRLAWDSDFWGFEIGRVKVDPDETPEAFDERLAASLVKGRYQLFEARLTPGSSLEPLLRSRGFWLADRQVDFRLLAETIELPDNCLWRVAVDDDLPLLRSSIHGLFRTTRYSRFPFGPEAADRFYTTWIEASVRGSFDDICLLLEAESVHAEILGFVTLRFSSQPPRHSRIGLLGVTHAQQGRGVGSRLLQVARYSSARQGLPILHVKTQVDNRATALYRSAGATVASHEDIYLLHTGRPELLD